MCSRVVRVSTIVRDIDDSKCLCQDDIRLILLLMYTTIIMWSIYYWVIKLPRYFTSALHFTHMRKWGYKWVYQSILRLSASAHRPHYFIFVIKTARGQPHTLSACRQFETAQMVRPHSSAAEYALKAARWNGTRKVNYTRAFRLLLCFKNEHKN